MKYWIKERHNPQLGVYYVAMGRMSKANAKHYESPIYGSNEMLSFDTEADYYERIKQLKKEGQRVS